jgi:catechol 2,3-dioxygenase-like lactoylglutathione lyase family enzyme
VTVSLSRINHAGLTVTDIEAAVAWYCEVFDLRLVFGPNEVSGPGRAQAIFGEGFGAMRRAVMSDQGGVALELFEFLQPATTRRDDNFEYWKTGIFHICLTCRDVPSQLAAVVTSGGRARTEPLDAGGGRLIAYCEDPFGNVLELTNKTIDETYPSVPGE